MIAIDGINVDRHEYIVKRETSGAYDMKVSKAQAQANRRRIIEVAGELFRERGFDGIGVNDLMQAASLTRGGFYGHFESKEDLARQASEQALAATTAQWSRTVDKAADPLAELVDLYLSDRHRNSVGRGCALAALGSDALRHGDALREVFGAGVESFVAAVAAKLPEGREAERRERALAVVATLVGALMLSRVSDEDLSRELRAAAGAAILRGNSA